MVCVVCSTAACFGKCCRFGTFRGGFPPPHPHRLTCDAARAGGTAQKARALSPCPRAECVSLSVRQGVSVRNYKDDKAVFTIPYRHPPLNLFLCYLCPTVGLSSFLPRFVVMLPLRRRPTLRAIPRECRRRRLLPTPAQPAYTAALRLSRRRARS